MQTTSTLTLLLVFPIIEIKEEGISTGRLQIFRYLTRIKAVENGEYESFLKSVGEFRDFFTDFALPSNSCLLY